MIIGDFQITGYWPKFAPLNSEDEVFFHFMFSSQSLRMLIRRTPSPIGLELIGIIVHKLKHRFTTTELYNQLILRMSRDFLCVLKSNFIDGTRERIFY